MDVAVFCIIDIIKSRLREWKNKKKRVFQFARNLFALRFSGLHKLRCKLLVCLWFSNFTIFRFFSFLSFFILLFFLFSLHLSHAKFFFHQEPTYGFKCILKMFILNVTNFSFFSFTQRTQFDNKAVHFQNLINMISRTLLSKYIRWMYSFIF